MEVFVDGVLTLREALEAYNQGRREQIELTEENQTFLDAVASAQEQGLPEKAVYLYLTEILGYGQGE